MKKFEFQGAFPIFILGGLGFTLLTLILLFVMVEDFKWKKENKSFKELLYTSPMSLIPACIAGVCIGDGLLKVTNTPIRPFLTNHEEQPLNKTKTIYYQGYSRRDLYSWLQDNLFGSKYWRPGNQIHRDLSDNEGFEGYLEFKADSNNEKNLRLQTIYLTHTICDSNSDLMNLLSKLTQNYSLKESSGSAEDIKVFVSPNSKVMVLLSTPEYYKNPFYKNVSRCQHLKITLH